MAEQNVNATRVTFSVTGLSQTLHVLRFSGDEAMSSLFRAEIDLASESDAIDFASVVGQPGLLTITGELGPRYLHGLVASFEQREKTRKFTLYHAVLVPKVWRLTHRRDCRIFQNVNAKQIVSKVLDKVLSGDEYQFKLKADPVEREYCVQYRESDWAFASRLLEEEGIFYYFEHSADKHVLKLANDFQAHPSVTGKEAVPYHPPSPTLPGKEHVVRFNLREQVESGKVTLQDFNFKTPAVSLKAEKEGETATELEIYDYPGEYLVQKEGQDLAQVRLQEVQAPRVEAEGDSDAVRMTPGYYFALEEHPRFSDKYVITFLRQRGEKATTDLEAGAADPRCAYTNSFRCIPRKTPFRPARFTPRPIIQGPQTAIVVGPSGQEIYVDKYGRVKVQFHWDRHGTKDEKSSCWIRVSQVWAGALWGSMYIPRIGQEVIVEFLEGDPDRPIITGRVYHAQNMPPYTLPDDKTKSTIKSNSSIGGGGYNEVRFEDKKGSEELYTHAQKDQTEVIRNDISKSVGANSTTTIGKNRKVTIKEGNDELTLEKGNRTVTLKAGNKTLDVTGEISESATEKITLKVGGSTIVLDPSGILIQGPMVKINP
jgi:type VI secretion system secreted protein VgrG